MDPKFSVIIPFYNTPEEKFSRCIKSIVCQSYSNFEIIVIDDGSTSKHALSLDSIAKSDARIKVIHKNNEGSAIARNTGIEIATGDYITFIDSDDFISSYCFKQAKDIIVETNSDLVIGLVKKFSENDTHALAATPCMERKIQVLDNRKDITTLVNHMLGYDSTQDYLYELGYIGDGPVARFCSSKIVRQAMFSPESMCSDDTIWNLKMIAKCSKIALVNDFWYAYLVFYGSKSRSFRLNSENEVAYRIRQYYDLVQRLWPECNKGLYMKVWRETFIYTSTYLFHQENPISTSEKKKAFKRFVSNPDYREMLRHISFSSTENILTLVLKKMVVLCTLYKIYSVSYGAWKYFTDHNRM